MNVVVFEAEQKEAEACPLLEAQPNLVEVVDFVARAE